MPERTKELLLEMGRAGVGIVFSGGNDNEKLGEDLFSAGCLDVARILAEENAP